MNDPHATPTLSRSMRIDNVDITLSHPVSLDVDWIGQDEPMRQLLACWLVVGEKDLPLTPRLTGHPGLGKTTLALAGARRCGRTAFVMQCTSDTRPEDLLITPVLSSGGQIAYHASPLLTAVLTGGVAVLDEGNRMSEKSWASLAGLFDNRRSVESIVAGVSITAHPEFRAVVTMNEDSSTFEIPDYIMSRLQPGIEMGFPNRADEMRILTYTIPFSDEQTLALCVDFLQRAHGLDLPFSVRDGINAIRYTLKMRTANPEASTETLFENALRQILGPEALDLDSLAQRRRAAGNHLPAMRLGDYFFGDDDSLNPEQDNEPQL